uniref:Tetraspanin n=3 Tax=Dendroctonus ponderosae TaxID=77166 RepID=A0AAR5PY64_DENPD
MVFSSYQARLILDHCGRDFRLSHLSYPFYEQLTMTFLEVALSIAGLIGLWTKRGAVYFVAISFWICTVMIQHFADLLMGIIYLLSYGHGLDGVERFLRRNFENLKESNIFATAKINRIQKCKQCCGINGIDDDYVRLSNDTLISGCCPPDTILPCTRERAYKDGCALKLLEDEYNIGIFHALSAVSIIFQFYNYRASLSAFV